jgi:hypothetical protein
VLWLHKLYYEPQYRKGRHRFPLKLVAEVAGLNRNTLCEALMTSKVSEATCCKLSWAIRTIEERRLLFCGTPRPRAFMPPRSPPAADRSSICLREGPAALFLGDAAGDGRVAGP